jgi:microcompartment protein CcmK/EutM
MSSLIFDDDSHTYTLNEKELMSVSELVKPISSLAEFDRYLENAIEIAAERGTTCHSIIELLLKGESIEGEYPSEYENYVDGIKLFLVENEIEPIYIEQPFACESLGIAGTPDLICIFSGEVNKEQWDNAVTIVDYKFVSQVDKTRVAAQLNSYNAICINNGIEIEKLLVIQFLPDGKYRKYPVAIDDEDFGLLLALKLRKERKHPRGGIA